MCAEREAEAGTGADGAAAAEALRVGQDLRVRQAGQPLIAGRPSPLAAATQMRAHVVGVFRSGRVLATSEDLRPTGRRGEIEDARVTSRQNRQGRIDEPLLVE